VSSVDVRNGDHTSYQLPRWMWVRKIALVGRAHVTVATLPFRGLTQLEASRSLAPVDGFILVTYGTRAYCLPAMVDILAKTSKRP
jgi:hypothetical protein